MPVTPQNVELSNDVVSGAVVYPHGLEMAFIGVDELHPHPMNTNSTDTDIIGESIEVNGFVMPLLVQTSTGYIIDGWHRYTAALERGAQFVPCILLDCDDATARRLLVAINRTARLGTDDPGLVRDLMDRIQADDARLLGTGWTPIQYDTFLEMIESPYTPDVEDIDPVRQRHVGITCPACGHEFGGGR